MYVTIPKSIITGSEQKTGGTTSEYMKLEHARFALVNEPSKCDLLNESKFENSLLRKCAVAWLRMT